MHLGKVSKLMVEDQLGCPLEPPLTRLVLEAEKGKEEGRF